MIERRCQIAVVGGGPAGLAAAAAAAEAGARSVALVERKREWGRPVQCAGYVPRLLGRLIRFEGAAIRSRLDFLDLYLNGERLKSSAAPGYVLRRDVWERQMAEAAQEAGVQCLRPARVAEVGDGELAIESAEGLTRLRAEAIIGADGPRSMVRARMGLKAQPLAFGMEYELPLAAPSRVAQVHFAAEYGAGYAWVFPHGQTAGVGLALDEDRRAKLRQLLDEFVDSLKGSAIEGYAQPLGVVSGPIPVGGPAQMTVSGALMLAGDAAGQTNPLTGAGLYSAVACGQMAGRAAAKAVKAGDISLLQSYEKEWRDLFGALLERSLCGRNGMAGASAQDFREAVARAWRLAPHAGKKGAAHGRAQAPGRGIQA